ncbi:hypothetical protein [Photorhabdus bodei]|uniref:Leucine-rich repeat domain-containing protein n=1 Tax=Photorhabdus bodei TaxID=2029681 RepID=A0AAW6BK27_9GAMM|nr:hypothetical protein [Photorhabdus bodei]MDB6373858.1 hypothetical protein [Photorhabdus bodei]
MKTLIEQLTATNANFSLSGNRVIVHSDLKVCGRHDGLLENYLSVDDLPAELTVKGSLHVGRGIRALPAALVVGKNLYISYSDIETLPDNLTINGSLLAISVKLKALPENLTVKDGLNISNTDITKLPSNLKVEHSMILAGSKITALPDNLHLKGILNVEKVPLQKLPENLRVEKWLIIGNTEVTTIPVSLSCGAIYMNNPLEFENVVSEVFSTDYMDHVFALRTADGIRVSNGEYYGDPETFALMMIDNYNADEAEYYIASAKKCTTQLESMNI